MKTMITLLISVLMTSAAFAANAPATLALNWKAEPEFGGFYAASLQGFYKTQGLDVQILEGGSGTPTVQMLANNKVDFAIVSADELIISQDKNKVNKVKALFAVYQKSPYIVMTHAERNFKSLKDVFTNEGFLSMQSGLPYYQFLVQKFGKPKVRVVPYLGGVSNFVNDMTFSQQGFITIEPLSAEKAGAKVKNFLIADEGFNPYLVVLATTEETLKNKPELVQKVLTATREGWAHYLKDPKATNEHMATLNKAIDLTTFNKAADIQKPLIETTGVVVGSMTDERWDTLVQQMKKLKLIKSTPKASDLYVK
ncbi:ABC transporter substrate-binding protein [Bdellovibrio bacteriovorus]|uniref:Thiamine pyrimidine synthase n=1 Tax=Bdellovibrio bacteriovorus str. Tiberius TaxID=1069642 RepID=K7YPA5_BDEBC|nr:ABC transporter substrate-binding protein [Bdellovibrio bacteriovorus]AFY01676.1 ABC-type transporter nitrate-binding protein [Bdellovibrio bacteriovorus str. Tiberius]